MSRSSMANRCIVYRLIKHNFDFCHFRGTLLPDARSLLSSSSSRFSTVLEVARRRRHSCVIALKLKHVQKLRCKYDFFQLLFFRSVAISSRLNLLNRSISFWFIDFVDFFFSLCFYTFTFHFSLSLVCASSRAAWRLNALNSFLMIITTFNLFSFCGLALEAQRIHNISLLIIDNRRFCFSLLLGCRLSCASFHGCRI